MGVVSLVPSYVMNASELVDVAGVVVSTQSALCAMGIADG